MKLSMILIIGILFISSFFVGSGDLSQRIGKANIGTDTCAHQSVQTGRQLTTLAYCD